MAQANIVSIWGWDSYLRIWKVYPRENPYPLLSEVKPDTGYWIETSQPFELDKPSSTTSSSYELQQGWNLIGYRNSQYSITSQTLINLEQEQMPTVVVNRLTPLIGQEFDTEHEFIEAIDNQFSTISSTLTDQYKTLILKYEGSVSISDFIANKTYWEYSCGHWQITDLWGRQDESWKVYFSALSDLEAFNQELNTNFELLTTILPGMAIWVHAIPNNSSPTAVPSSTGCYQVSSGNNHTCALLSNGTIKCWGKGDQGQLGNNTTSDQNIPVLVKNEDLTSLTGAIQVTTGASHSCALLDDKSVKCWGKGSSGQLGNAGIASTSSSTVLTVTGLTTVKQISAGGDHTCALLEDKSVKCWGNADQGQLGDGQNSTNQHTPVAVDSINTATQISSGDNHTCALLEDKTIRCWGNGSLGELGNGKDSASFGGSSYIENKPVTVSNMYAAIQISAGESHTCALLQDKVQCWGDGSSGELGNGKDKITTKDSTYHETTPVSVRNIARALQISTGTDHTCALLNDNTLRCWGSGDVGRLGQGSTLSQSTPASVQGISTAVEVSAGATHTCALLKNGKVQCWGSATNGKLGNGREVSLNVPIPVNNIFSADQISSGNNHTCTLLEDGSAYCWGEGSSGQLGNGSTSSQNDPVRVSLNNKITQVSAGGNHTCALLSDSSLYCWGEGVSGKLGSGNEKNQSTPFEVTHIATSVPNTSRGTPVQVSAGGDHTCVLLSDNKIRCWGEGSSGQLGNGNQFDSSTAVAVENIFTATQVGAGRNHSCALINDGITGLLSNRIVCWGGNSEGQLGNGSLTLATTTATAINDLSDTVATHNILLGMPTQLSVGGDHACALLRDSTVRCWGKGDSGQLGNGSTTDATVPTEVSDIDTAIQVSAGDDHTCVLLSDQTIQCWGQGTSGQLGNDSTSDQSTPVPVRNIDTAVQVSAGGTHTCTILADNRIECWGEGASGPVGEGHSFFSTPVLVHELDTDEEI
ncbi:MAG: hypothetical protein HQM14_00040 [SAR324 cluster bacterium]|nr:hypothetical protein [SAR324 cluster bacterium]